MPVSKKIYIPAIAVLLGLVAFKVLGPGAPDAPSGSTVVADSAAELANGSEAAVPSAAHANRPAITVTPAELAVLRDRVRASGLVAAVERILIQPQIEGQAIDSIEAEVGDHVAAGTVLARLSETALKLQKSQLAASRASAVALIAQAQAQLIEATASAAEAKRTWDRTDQLRKQGNASQAAADQARTAKAGADARVMVAAQGEKAARAQLDLVDAQIENVELQLARTQITAPFAGEIVERNALAGSIASAAGQPMFVLVRDGLLELNADIAEQDLPRIANGMRVSLRAAGSDVALTGTVRLVEPAIDTVSRLGRARITIDQADRIRTGMFLEAEISVSEREVLAVPITALGTDEQGAFVMVVDKDGKIHHSPVVVGIRDGKRVEIQSGIAKDDQVVAKAASFVHDGDLVNPVLAPAAPATN